MRKKEETGSIIEMCPVRNVIARFGNKWAFLTLLIIGEQGIVRFNELSSLVRVIVSPVFLTVCHDMFHICERPFGQLADERKKRLTDFSKPVFDFWWYFRIYLAVYQAVGFKGAECR